MILAQKYHQNAVPYMSSNIYILIYDMTYPSLLNKIEESLALLRIHPLQDYGGETGLLQTSKIC